MSKNNDKVYYAVGKGRTSGIYNSWPECKAQIDGITNAKFRKFYSITEAEEFVDFWKNYESPSKESSDTKNVVSNISNGRGLLCEREGRNEKKCSKKGYSKLAEIPPLLPELYSKKEGSNQMQGENYKTPYISPLFCQINSQFIGVRNKNLNRNSNRKSKRKTSLNGGSDMRKKNSGTRVDRSHSVDAITAPKTSFQFIASCNMLSVGDTVLSEPNISSDSSNIFNDSTEFVTSTQNIFPKCNPPSGNTCSESDFLQVNPVCVRERVKEEVVDVDGEINDSQGSDEKMTEVSEKLTICLSMLESALKLIADQEKAKNLRSCLKAFVEKIMTGTNAPVNPQMESGGNVKNCEESTTETDGQHAGTEMPLQSTPSYREHLTPPSPHQTFLDQKNVDVLALNLRLDSFEKRFDACLKEVGAIVSEMSNIKADIKEIKDTLSSFSASGSAHTPKKSKGGMLQTTLRFNPLPNSEGITSSPASKEGENSGEPAAKRSKTLKRRLSKSFTNRSEDEDEDEGIISRIKMEAVDYTSFNVDSDEFVEVYTDGACQMNGKTGAKAGIGIWFGDSHPLNVAAPVDGPATNNSAEIQAARVAVELAIKAGISKLKILTDSAFLINCATKWIRRWKKNGWTLVDGGPVKNRKELEKLDKVASRITIRWEKVEAHTGIKGNEMADRLANEGASKYNR